MAETLCPPPPITHTGRESRESGTQGSLCLYYTHSTPTLGRSRAARLIITQVPPPTHKKGHTETTDGKERGKDSERVKRINQKTRKEGVAPMLFEPRSRILHQGNRLAVSCGGHAERRQQTRTSSLPPTTCGRSTAFACACKASVHIWHANI